METKDFRTATEFVSRENAGINTAWIEGIDLGYSGVKVFSEMGYGCFPSYAKKVEKDFTTLAPKPEMIVYTDLETGDKWLVGAMAEDITSSGDTSDTENTLYGRYRYYSPMFKIISETAMGLAMIKRDGNNFKNINDNRKVVIQTGLPEDYMEDADALKETMLGRHAFKLELFDSKEPIEFRFGVDDVYVMPQPKGSLFSICVKNDGTLHELSGNFMSDWVIVFDPGFGTLDIYPIKSGHVEKGYTNSNLGMRRVLSETSALIKRQYNIDVPVTRMQKYLETGKVVSHDRRNFRSESHDFTDLLAKANAKVCEEALDTLRDAVPDLAEYKYLIVTGGTGEAWLPIIEERLSGMETLTVIAANQNDKLPMMYSNVRGYYLSRYAAIMSGQKQ